MIWSRLERIYAMTLLVILAGIVIHAPLSVGLGVLFPDYALLIKSWKEIIMLALIPLACVIVTRRHLWRTLANDWVFRLIIGFTAVHLLLLIFRWQGAAPTVAGLAIDLRYILFFSLVYLAIRYMPSLRRYFLIVATIGAAVVVGFATLQLFLPPDILSHIGYSKETISPYLTVDKNPDYIRVNSTLRGPNPLGAYAGMVLGLLMAAWLKGRLVFADRRVRFGANILAACSLVALWISYSRSALLGALITLCVVVGVILLRKASWRVWTGMAVVLIILTGGIIAARNTSFVSNVILHENQNGGSDISSNEGHAASLDYGFKRLLQEPLGSGVGSTGSASLLGPAPTIVENQYLFTAHETGWLGLGLFLALLIVIMKRLWQRRTDWLSLGLFASGIGLTFIGLLLPVWVDDTVSVVWWGLAAIVVGGIYGKPTKQKAA